MNFQVTSFQWPYFTDSPIISPSGIDILPQLPPFSIFNYHFTDWHLWTFVNMFSAFFFPGWHKHISKQSGKSIRWTVQRHHSGRQQWDKLGRKKKNQCAGILRSAITMVETSRWEIHGSFSKGADRQKSDVCVEYVTGHVCKSDKYVCVFTYVHMVHCTYMRYIFIDCVYVFWIAVYVCMCVCDWQGEILAIVRHPTNDFQHLMFILRSGRSFKNG